jgi:hypothetical protein
MPAGVGHCPTTAGSWGVTSSSAVTAAQSNWTVSVPPLPVVPLASYVASTLVRHTAVLSWQEDSKAAASVIVTP